MFIEFQVHNFKLLFEMTLIFVKIQDCHILVTQLQVTFELVLFSCP